MKRPPERPGMVWKRSDVSPDTSAQRPSQAVFVSIPALPGSAFDPGRTARRGERG
jgi:hypothetical protein